MTVPALYVYKCLLFLKDSDIKKVGENHNYMTRHRNRLAVVPHRTVKYETHPSYMGIKFFNTLPSTITGLGNKEFKTKIRNVLNSNPIYSLNEFFEIRWL